MKANYAAGGIGPCFSELLRRRRLLATACVQDGPLLRSRIKTRIQFESAEGGFAYLIAVTQLQSLRGLPLKQAQPVVVFRAAGRPRPFAV